MPKGNMSHLQSLFAIRGCRIAARTDQHLLLTLALHCNKTSPTICWPSVPTLAEETGYSQRTIQRSLLSLKRLGLIKIHHRFNQSNRYRIELDALARAVENAERERAERERNKKIAAADFGDWDDDFSKEAQAVDEDPTTMDEAAEESYMDVNDLVGAAIADMDDPRYLVSKLFPTTDPLHRERTIAKACEYLEDVFVTMKQFLECPEDEANHAYNRLIEDRVIRCDGFIIQLDNDETLPELNP